MKDATFYKLSHYFIKKWLVILVAALIGLAVGGVYTFFVQRPQYKSSAVILLTDSNHPEKNQSSATLNTYANLFTSRRVLDPVIDKVHYEGSYQKLLSRTVVKNIKNTDMITASISDGDAKMSTMLLQAAIKEFMVQKELLYGKRPTQIKVVDAVNTPSEPSNIEPAKQIGFTVLVAIGLSVIGVLIAYDVQMSRRATN